MAFRRKGMLAAVSSFALMGPASVAMAQETGFSTVEEVIVTGTKQAGGVSVQEAPLAVTAFGERQLEEQHIRTVTELTTSVPNVNLNASITQKGTAAFGIRGMSIYSTIPSSTPAVGIFQDGVYFGTNAGSIVDTFDLEGIEVLRGPQGLLFGRNVTAGALLLRTSEPTDELSIKAKASVESGPSFTTSMVLSGPVAQGVSAKLAIYHNEDLGWFKNLYDGERYGGGVTDIFRLALKNEFSETLENVLRLERGVMDGDAPPNHNLGFYERDTFDFVSQPEAYNELQWTQVTNETRLGVGFGEGEVINILAFRGTEHRALADTDGRPTTLFHLHTGVRHEQISEELRYSGRVGPGDLTAGVYYFTDEMFYVENRPLATSDVTGGGEQKSSTWAIFTSYDLQLPHNLVLNLGARYSEEEKAAKVQSIVSTSTSPCSFIGDNFSCTGYNFEDEADWSAFTPKIGFQWEPSSDLNVYAYWTKGYRSGGYNLRRQGAAPPGPYDQEEQSAYELGAKARFFDSRLRTSAAVFYNEYSSIQRDVVTPHPTFGTLQITTNAADVTISGAEFEVEAVVSPKWMVQANVGYLHDSIDKVYYDLSGNGSIGPEDYNLSIPFVAPWSFGVSVRYESDVPLGELSGRLAFNHRDNSFSNDGNRGKLKAENMLEGNLSLGFDNGFTVSAYGKNLLNQVTWGVNNPLGAVAGGAPDATFTSLNKGRVLGLELSYSY